MSSTGRRFSNFCRNSQRLLHATPNPRPPQIISHKKKIPHLRTQFLNRRQSRSVSQIVLRQSPSINLHVHKRRRRAHLEQRLNLPVNQRRQRFVRKHHRRRIGRPPNKTGQQHKPLRRPPGKQRRIPHCPQHPQSARPRHQEPESAQRVTHIRPPVTQRNHRHWRILDLAQQPPQFRIHFAQHSPRHIRRRSNHHPLRQQRLFSACIPYPHFKFPSRPVARNRNRRDLRVQSQPRANLRRQSSHQRFVPLAKTQQRRSFPRTFAICRRAYHPSNHAARRLLRLMQLRKRAPQAEPLRIASINSGNKGPRQAVQHLRPKLSPHKARDRLILLGSL